MSQYIKQQILFLSKQLGIDIFLDDKNKAILLIDGVHPISIRLVDDDWQFHAMICYASDVMDSNGSYKKIFSVNISEQEYEGGWLCLDESENAILYMLNPTCNDHAEDLYNKLNEFVNRADAIREMLLSVNK
ncbi:CesT family type III secretion system chaperone [Yersinia mollaretii]|uniref:CesT family type III secretion system chaperone n=1 Tax=Yersinia mollaretii TaxID=33060 RepID=UPI00164397AA|nr:CesT family type III secretion system chaperone [Yersinia mollaretii]